MPISIDILCDLLGWRKTPSQKNIYMRACTSHSAKNCTRGHRFATELMPLSAFSGLQTKKADRSLVKRFGSRLNKSL